LTTDYLFWLAAFVCLYMAWNIGANDVANAMGTSVGSKALTLLQAIVLAGILEFAGATLVGSYVTDTVRKGIVDPAVFAGEPRLLATGMTAALTGAAVWLNVATYLGWPVSTTHSIVGAVAGFGIVAGGAGAISWGTLGAVVASWVISPAVGGLVAYLLYRLVRWRIIQTRNPGIRARENAPYLVAGMLFVLTLVMLFKGLKNLKLDLLWYHSVGLALAVGVAGGAVVRTFGRPTSATQTGRAEMERLFRYLQIATASFVAFAHGANDVANAVGPMAAVFAVLESGTVVQKVHVPLWILMLGGAGIVVGLATYGYKVMATIGGKITEITPSRGFAAEFGAAITILVGSKLGLPLSTTHTLVGAVVGVGFARGMTALNLAVVRNIIVSWLLTIPFAAGVCIGIFYLLRAL
jgi:PiT family inorganic phosphate transporter